MAETIRHLSVVARRERRRRNERTTAAYLAGVIARARHAPPLSRFLETDAPPVTIEESQAAHEELMTIAVPPRPLEELPPAPR